jgi:excisionase family DNA binding protein
MTTSYRTRGAAHYLGVSKSFLDKKAAEGGGPAYRRPGRIRIYDQPDLDAYKRATRVEPNTPATEPTLLPRE